MSNPTNATPGRLLSAIAYKKAAAQLCKSRKKVFDHLRRVGPETANQIEKALSQGRWAAGNVRSRLLELEKDCLVYRKRLVIDPNTGFEATLWAAIEPENYQPKPPKRQRPTRRELERELMEMQADNDALRTRIEGLLLQLQEYEIKTSN